MNNDDHIITTPSASHSSAKTFNTSEKFGEESDIDDSDADPDYLPNTDQPHGSKKTLYFSKTTSPSNSNDTRENIVEEKHGEEVGIEDRESTAKKGRKRTRKTENWKKNIKKDET